MNTVKITAKIVESDIADGVTRDWCEIYGADEGTGYEFDREFFSLTSDNKILNCDGYPMTEGDRQTIAVRRAIRNI